MSDKREALISGNICSLMMKLSIPGIVGMLVISFYSFVDGIFVGRYVGEAALGAVSIAYPFTLLNNGIAVLVGIGSASVLSRAVGREDKKTIDAVIGNVLILTLLFSSVVMILGYTFAPQFLKLVGAEDTMLDLSVRYLRIVYLGSIFVNFGQASNMVIRGEGKMVLAMIFMGISAVLNIILDAVFIISFGMGMEGAAIATVISQVVLAVLNFLYFAVFSKNVRLTRFKLEKSIVKDTLSVGVSAMFMQIFTLQQAVIYSTLKRYGGESQVVLMGAFFRYLMLAFIPLWGISQGFQPFAGTNFGAKCFDRVKKGTFSFYAFAFGLALIFWAIFLASPKGILGLFITNNPELIASGKTDTLLAIILFPLSALMIINITLFQAVGKAKYAGMLVMARQLVLYVPAVLILPLFFGVRGVWIAGTVTDTFVAAASMIIVLKLFKTELGKHDAQ